MIGALPRYAQAPLDYTYALDAAMPTLANTGTTLVLCNVPQLMADVQQRLPAWTANGPAQAALWVEPLRHTWQSDLDRLIDVLPVEGRLVAIVSRPLARLIPERRGWTAGGLGLAAGGVAQLRRRLLKTGFHLDGAFGVHSLAAILLSQTSRQVARRWPAWGDRLHFAARRRYCRQGPPSVLSTVTLLVAHKGAGNRGRMNGDR